jgi:hypothetical protein
MFWEFNLNSFPKWAIANLKRFLFCNFEKQSPKKTLLETNDLDQWIKKIGNGLILFVIGV